MKRIKYIVFSLITLIIGIGMVKAADPTYSLGVSNSTIYDGGRVTASVTLRNTAAWNVRITSAGNTNGCSESFVSDSGTGKDVTKTLSVTCKANSVGSISFTISGDITSSTGKNINVSGSKRVTVLEPKPASTINSLTDLQVTGYSLSPVFDPDTLEYNVTVPSTTMSVNITATKKDSASEISGAGDITVNEGSNKIQVNVTAESGDVRTYTINVTVEDINPIIITLDNVKYTLLKTSRNLEIPALYTEATIKINDLDIPCFKNDVNGLTLVALKDENGQVSYFIYNEGTYTKYYELSSVNLLIYPIKEEIKLNNWHLITKEIEGDEIEVYQYLNQERYYLIYGMNLGTGAKDYYLYDSKEGTYQVFNEELFNSLIDDANFYLYMLLGSAGVILLCLIIIIALCKKKKGHGSKEDVNDIEKSLSKNELKKQRKEEKKALKEQKRLEKQQRKAEKKEDKADGEEAYNILKDE